MGYTLPQTNAYLREAARLEAEQLAALATIVRAAAGDAFGGGEATVAIVRRLTEGDA